MHFEQAAHYSFNAGDDRAVARTPDGAVGPCEYDRCYPYTSCNKAGIFECSEHIAHDDWSTGVGVTRSTKAVGSAESYDQTSVTGCTGWGD